MIKKIVFVSLGLCFCSLTVKSQLCSKNQLPLNLQDRLQAFFPFCGNYNDASQNGYHGSPKGAVPFINDRFNKPSSAILLGLGYLTAPTAVFTFQRQEQFSLSMWFTKSDGNNGGRLLSTECPEGNFRMAALGGENYGVQYGDYISDNVPLNQWTHLVYTYDNRNEKVYINGVLKYTNYDASTEKLTYCAPFTIGAKASPAYDKWPGSFDDLLVYSRVLSDCEVLQLYNATSNNIPETSGTSINIFPDSLTLCKKQAILNSGNSPGSYIWNTGETTNSINVQSSGLYKVTITNGNCVSFDSVFVTLHENNYNLLLDDSVKICGQSTSLNAGPGFTNYNWNNGATGQITQINSSGMYKVVASDGICTISDSCFASIASVQIVQKDTTVCKATTLILNAVAKNATNSSSFCTNAQIPQNLKNGLIAYYPFCGSAEDISSNANNGTVQNLEFQQDRFGNSNSSGKFTKLNKSFIYVPAKPSMQPQSFTLSTWFNTNIIQYGGLESGQDQFIAGSSPKNWLNGPSYTHYLTVDDNSILASMLWTSQTSWQNIKTPVGTIKPNKWYHAVTTYDNNTGIHKFYLDGVLITQRQSKIEYLDQSGFYIGSSRQNSKGIPDTFFDGAIDDVGLWNRPFTDAEVLQLFDAQQNLLWSTGATNNSIQLIADKSSNYWVTVTDGITTCTDTVSITVSIPDTTMTVLDPTEICSNTGKVRLVAGVGNSFQWFKNGLALPSSNAKNLLATSSGYYTFSITNNLGCTDTSRSIVVTEHPLPVGSITTLSNTNICEGRSLDITATGGSSYQWYYNGNILPNAVNSRYSAQNPGTYSVDLVSDKGCRQKASNSITLTLLNKPIANFTYTSFCEGVPSNFSSNSSTTNAGPLSYKWIFPDGTSAYGSTLSHQFKQSGPYKVQLVAQPELCPSNADTATQIINVEKAIQAIRYPAINAMINKSVTLVARSIGDQYAWSPALNLSNPFSSRTDVVAKKQQDYAVSITNKAGCITTDSVLLRVYDERNIYVAQGFTPNGDGKNDRVYPIAIGIAEIRYFKIYNRWGNLVFQSKSLSASDGWDGSFRGIAQPSDTYTWIAEGIDYDGILLRKSGSIALIR